MTDVTALIARWRKGDERAAELIYNQHRDAIFRMAYGMLGDAQDAEEVAQDALTYALVNINRYDPNRASFNTWLHTIAISRCRDKRRRKVLPSFSLTTWLQRGQDLPANAPHAEQTTAVSESKNRVWQAVQQLKPSYREAIVLRYWAGHTYREIAEIMGCPLPTAQSRVRLAYDHLRRHLAPADLAAWETERN